MESREHSYASEQPAMKIGDLVVISENAGVKNDSVVNMELLLETNAGWLNTMGKIEPGRFS